MSGTRTGGGGLHAHGRLGLAVKVPWFISGREGCFGFDWVFDNLTIGCLLMSECD